MKKIYRLLLFSIFIILIGFNSNNIKSKAADEYCAVIEGSKKKPTISGNVSQELIKTEHDVPWIVYDGHNYDALNYSVKQTTAESYAYKGKVTITFKDGLTVYKNGKKTKEKYGYTITLEALRQGDGKFVKDWNLHLFKVHYKSGRGYYVSVQGRHLVESNTEHANEENSRQGTVTKITIKSDFKGPICFSQTDIDYDPNDRTGAGEFIMPTGEYKTHHLDTEDKKEISSSVSKTFDSDVAQFYYGKGLSEHKIGSEKFSRRIPSSESDDGWKNEEYWLSVNQPGKAIVHAGTKEESNGKVRYKKYAVMISFRKSITYYYGQHNGEWYGSDIWWDPWFEPPIPTNEHGRGIWFESAYINASNILYYNDNIADFMNSDTAISNIDEDKIDEYFDDVINLNYAELLHDSTKFNKLYGTGTSSTKVLLNPQNGDTVEVLNKTSYNTPLEKVDALDESDPEYLTLSSDSIVTPYKVPLDTENSYNKYAYNHIFDSRDQYYKIDFDDLVTTDLLKKKKAYIDDRDSDYLYAYLNNTKASNAVSEKVEKDLLRIKYKTPFHIVANGLSIPSKSGDSKSNDDDEAYGTIKKNYGASPYDAELFYRYNGYKGYMTWKKTDKSDARKGHSIHLENFFTQINGYNGKKLNLKKWEKKSPEGNIHPGYIHGDLSTETFPYLHDSKYRSDAIINWNVRKVSGTWYHDKKAKTYIWVGYERCEQKLSTSKGTLVLSKDGNDVLTGPGVIMFYPDNKEPTSGTSQLTIKCPNGFKWAGVSAATPNDPIWGADGKTKSKTSGIYYSGETGDITIIKAPHDDTPYALPGLVSDTGAELYYDRWYPFNYPPDNNALHGLMVTNTVGVINWVPMAANRNDVVWIPTIAKSKLSVNANGCAFTSNPTFSYGLNGVSGSVTLTPGASGEIPKVLKYSYDGQLINITEIVSGTTIQLNVPNFNLPTSGTSSAFPGYNKFYLDTDRMRGPGVGSPGIINITGYANNPKGSGKDSNGITIEPKVPAASTIIFGAPETGVSSDYAITYKEKPTYSVKINAGKCSVPGCSEPSYVNAAFDYSSYNFINGINAEDLSKLVGNGSTLLNNSVKPSVSAGLTSCSKGSTEFIVTTRLDLPVIANIPEDKLTNHHLEAGFVKAIGDFKGILNSLLQSGYLTEKTFTYIANGAIDAQLDPSGVTIYEMKPVASEIDTAELTVWKPNAGFFIVPGHPDPGTHKEDLPNGANGSDLTQTAKRDRQTEAELIDEAQNVDGEPKYAWSMSNSGGGLDAYAEIQANELKDNGKDWNVLQGVPSTENLTIGAGGSLATIDIAGYYRFCGYSASKEKIENVKGQAGKQDTTFTKEQAIANGTTNSRIMDRWTDAFDNMAAARQITITAIIDNDWGEGMKTKPLSPQGFGVLMSGGHTKSVTQSVTATATATSSNGSTVTKTDNKVINIPATDCGNGHNPIAGTPHNETVTATASATGTPKTDKDGKIIGYSSNTDTKTVPKTYTTPNHDCTWSIEVTKDGKGSGYNSDGSTHTVTFSGKSCSGDFADCVKITYGAQFTGSFSGIIKFIPVHKQYYKIEYNIIMSGNGSESKNVSGSKCNVAGEAYLNNGLTYGTGSSVAAGSVNAPNSYSIVYNELIDMLAYRYITDAYITGLAKAEITAVDTNVIDTKYIGYSASPSNMYGEMWRGNDWNQPLSNSGKKDRPWTLTRNAIGNADKTIADANKNKNNCYNFSWKSHAYNNLGESGKLATVKRSVNANGRLYFEYWKDPKLESTDAGTKAILSNIEVNDQDIVLGDCEVKIHMTQNSAIARAIVDDFENRGKKSVISNLMQNIWDNRLSTINITRTVSGHTETINGNKAKEHVKDFGQYTSNAPDKDKVSSDWFEKHPSGTAVEGDYFDTADRNLTSRGYNHDQVIALEQNYIINTWQYYNADTYTVNVISDNLFLGTYTNTISDGKYSNCIGSAYSIDGGIWLFNYPAGKIGGVTGSGANLENKDIENPYHDPVRNVACDNGAVNDKRVYNDIFRFHFGYYDEKGLENILTNNNITDGDTPSDLVEFTLGYNGQSDKNFDTKYKAKSPKNHTYDDLFFKRYLNGKKNAADVSGTVNLKMTKSKEVAITNVEGNLIAATEINTGGITRFQSSFEKTATIPSKTFKGYYRDHTYGANQSGNFILSSTGLTPYKTPVTFCGFNNESLYGTSLVIPNIDIKDSAPNKIYDNPVTVKLFWSTWADIRLNNSQVKANITNHGDAYSDTSLQVAKTPMSLFTHELQFNVNKIVDNKVATYDQTLSNINPIIIHDPISIESWQIIGEQYGNYTKDANIKNKVNNSPYDETMYDYRVGYYDMANKDKNNYAVIGEGFHLWVSDIGNFRDSSGSWSGLTNGSNKLGVNNSTNGADINTGKVNSGSRGYSNEMNTERWIKQRWVKFPFAVKYYSKDGTVKVHPANKELDLANVKSERGTMPNVYPTTNTEYGNISVYNGLNPATLNINNFTNMDSTFKYGFDYYFEIVQSAIEEEGAMITYGVQGINSNNILKSNTNNKSRRVGVADSSIKYTSDLDIVGRIGNLSIEDVTDPRYSVLLKKSKNTWAIDGVVHDVDIKTPINIFADKYDIYQNDATKVGHSSLSVTALKSGSDLYTGKAFKSFLNIKDIINKQNKEFSDAPIKAGYYILGDIETLGRYESINSGATVPTDSSNETSDTRKYKMTMSTDYVLYDYSNGKMYAIDIYEGNKGARTITYGGSDAKGNLLGKSKANLFIDIQNEKDRRNITDAEVYLTKKVNASAPIFNKTDFIGSTGDLVLDNDNITYIGSDFKYGSIRYEGGKIVSDKQSFSEGVLDPNGTTIDKSDYSYYGDKTLKTDANLLSDKTFIKNSQRYHFSYGLPSSTYITYANKSYSSMSQEDIEKSHDKIKSEHPDSVLLAFVNIQIKGEVWDLEYLGSRKDDDGKFKLFDETSENKPKNLNYNEVSYRNTPIYEITKDGSGNIVETENRKVNGQSIPFAIFDAWKTSDSDKAVTGTH